MHIPDEARESLDYIGLSPDQAALDAIDRKDLCSKVVSGPAMTDLCLSADHLERFDWRRNVLGILDEDRARAVTKGVRYRPFKDVRDYWFASATVGIPKVDAARVAYAVGEEMAALVKDRRLHELENLIAGVTDAAAHSLCEHYNIDSNNAEILFDDNATMVLYQFLGLLDLAEESSLLTFFDTGRVVPEAMAGVNPERMPFNFRPNIDIWNNRKHTLSPRNLNKMNVLLIEHYIGDHSDDGNDDHYRGDDAILEEIFGYILLSRPKVFLIPSVTRLGRRLPFVRYIKEIREFCETQMYYSPVIILDDAQGLSRLASYRYKEPGRDGEHIWENVDGIMGTGAKVTGALMGSGFLILNKDRLGTTQKRRFEESPLKYRARRYSFWSPDKNRILDNNYPAPQFAQTPEIASLTQALQTTPRKLSDFTGIRQLRIDLIKVLKEVEGITVMDRARSGASFVDSVVAFHLNGTQNAKKGGHLKQALAGLPEPITLPALVSADRRHYLRIALNPNRLDADSSVDYRQRVTLLALKLNEVMEEIMKS